MADDRKKYRPLKGGGQLQVESYPAPSGTLGCLAQTNRQGEPPRIVVLSVAHLLYAGRDGNALGPITQPGSRACQPVACSKCSRCCSDDIGRVLRGEFSQAVDAAVATLYAGTKYRKEVEEIGPIRGDHQITDAEAHNRPAPFHVRKRGIRTRLTEGEVRVLDFATDTRGVDDGFRRRARPLILIQPRTLVQAPITEIENGGVIRVDNAQFLAHGVDEKTHVIEISGPTRNRGLYKIHAIDGDKITAKHHLNPDFPEPLHPERQPLFTPVSQYFFVQGANGLMAPGIGAINPGLQPFDMVQIRNSTTNDNTYQVQPFFAQPIDQDRIAVYRALSQEPVNGAEARGVIFIRVREALFCDAADSGSVVVSDAGEVVGLLNGRVPDNKVRPELAGYGFATPIDIIKTNLGIKILTAQNAGEEAVVAEAEAEPGSPGGPVAIRAGGGALPLHEAQREVLLQAQQDLLETAGGRRHAELVRRHIDEVLNLVNTNRRVAVVWHRNGGPLLAQVALNAVQNPDVSIPAEINGLPLTRCLDTILGSWEKYGSADLRSDIAQFGPYWSRLASLSFNEVKTALAANSDDMSV